MTATSQALPRTAVPPAVVARFALWAVAVTNLLIVEALFVTSGAGKNSLLSVAKFFGLHAALIMMLQLLLVSRLPWLDRRIGMDRLTSWHRWVGFTLFWTVIVHSSIVILGYSVLSKTSYVRTFLALAGVYASLLGMCAAAVIFVAVGFSIRYARRRLSYETWHAVHFCLYAAVTLALLHQFFEGT